jgi:hypothetical protein
MLLDRILYLETVVSNSAFLCVEQRLAAGSPLVLGECILV